MKDQRVQHFLIMALIVIAAAALAVYSWIVLPDMVATQPAAFSTGAPPLPKLFCVALPRPATWQSVLVAPYLVLLYFQAISCWFSAKKLLYHFFFSFRNF